MKILIIGLVAYVLFVVQKLVYAKLWNQNLKVAVSFAQTGIHEGEKGEVLEVIENRKRLPLTMLKVKFQTSKHLDFGKGVNAKTTDFYYRNDVFQIGGGERITRKLSFVAKRRGYYNVRNIDLVGTDLFYSEEFAESMTTNCYLYVYPRSLDSSEFRLSLQKLNGEILVKRHLMEDPFEYRGIREYQPYDDIRSVNWKATARTGALKVNQKNYTALQTIRIFLNTEDDMGRRSESEIESTMQIAMGLTEFFLGQGIKVALYSNGKDIITGAPIKIEGGAGKGQKDVIGAALARLDTDVAAEDFAKLYEDKIISEADGTITLFVSANGFKDFVDLLERCDQAGVNYTWFYAYGFGSEPEVSESLKKHVEFMKVRF